jgi:hypothetical protein
MGINSRRILRPFTTFATLFLCIPGILLLLLLILVGQIVRTPTMFIKVKSLATLVAKILSADTPT